MIGASVGRYRIEAALGAGAMGQVYRAVDPDGAEVAVKLVRGRIASDPDTPVGLGAAVLPALLKDPAQRPHDARGYVASVRRAAGPPAGVRG